MLCAEEEEDRVGDLDDAWDPHVQVFCGTHLQVKTKQKGTAYHVMTTNLRRRFGKRLRLIWFFKAFIGKTPSIDTGF